MVDYPYQYEQQQIFNYVFDDEGRTIKVKNTVGGADVSLTNPSPIVAGDSFSIDAFGRWRVSTPETLFDSKQIFNGQSLFWDDIQASGTGTSSIYSQARAATTLAVAASTAGTRTRQTFMRFNYQPGKSQLVLITFVLDKTGDGPGITKHVGYGDANNGLFLKDNNGTHQLVVRSSTSGSPEDNAVDQDDWNIDAMNGQGPSGITLDFTKSQILFIDFEWLGVGRVRMGFVVDGKIYYAHEFTHANKTAVVYMSTPNLPIHYQISNDGTGAAASMDAICASIMSEGGVQDLGVLHHKDSQTLSSLTAGSTYALVGLRLQSSCLGGIVKIENVSVACSTANDFAHWDLRINPTVATLAASNWVNVDHSIVQSATGPKTWTITGGKELDGGFLSSALPSTITTPNALRIGSSIAGVPDTIFLCGTPVTNNISLSGSITWREAS